MKPLIYMLVLVASVLSCEGRSSLRNMGDSELAAKRDDCLRHNPTAPGRVTACENIRRECERRRKEGNYAC